MTYVIIFLPILIWDNSILNTNYRLFDAYRELYYEGGTSSVYLWDLDRGFAGKLYAPKDFLN